MNMKNVVSIAKMLVLLVALTMGTTLAFGQWQGPPGSPPANNVEPPINVSSAAQVKAGNLTVDGFGSTSITALAQSGSSDTYVGVGSNNHLYADALATFLDTAFFNKDVQILGGGEDPALDVSGNVYTSLNYKSDALVNNYALIDDAALCAEQDGTIVLCNPVNDLQSVAIGWNTVTESCNNITISFTAYPSGGSGHTITYAWERRQVSPTSTAWQAAGTGASNPGEVFSRDTDVNSVYEMRVTATDTTTSPNIVVSDTDTVNVPPIPPMVNGIPCAV